MKEKTFVLDIDFFKTALLVHFGSAQSCRGILENYDLTESQKVDIINALGGKPANGLVWTSNEGRMLMFLGFSALKKMPQKDMGVLVHECLHVAFGMLDYCGIQIEDNEELLCMTQQMVFNSVMNEIQAG